MTLLKIYESILRFAGMSADEKGYVSTLDGKDPIYIDGNRLVLPTTFQLRETTDKERIIFHPLAENIIRGESAVVKKLRNNINVRLNMSIGLIGQALLSLTASPAFHKRLNPSQLRLLTSISGKVDAKSAVNFSTGVVAIMKENPASAFVNIYLCRGGTHKDKKYSRLGVTSFPIYKKLENDEFGNCRVMDKPVFQQLLDFMFPNSNVEDEYNVGSDSTIAPFLEALLGTAGVMAFRLNELVELYEEFIPFNDSMTKEQLTFDSEWTTVFSNLEEFVPQIRSVPPQSDGPVQAPEPVATPAPQAPRAQAPAAAAAPAAPQVEKTKDGLNFNSLLATQAPQVTAPAAMQMMPQMVNTPQGPMTIQQAQQFGLPYQPIPPGYGTMMPAGMMPGGMMPPGMMPGGMQPVGPRVPTWAQVPATQQMVNTPQGPMSLAAAQQFGLPYQPIQQGPGNGIPMSMITGGYPNNGGWTGR